MFIHLYNPLVFSLLIIWSLIWKGLALWKSARRGEKVWYVVLLVVNTVGILEILYLYVFSRGNKKPRNPIVPPSSTAVPPTDQKSLPS